MNPPLPPHMTPVGRELAQEAHARITLDRRIVVLNAILIAMLLLLLVFGVYIWTRVASASEHAAERDAAIELIQAQLRDVCQETPNKELDDEARRNCVLAEQDKLPPEIRTIIGPEGPAGIQGLPGLPGEQGKRGPRGIQGPSPTPEQVSAAVHRYCLAQPGGSCEGAGPSEAEVLAAVTAFCADGRCRGSDGTDGSDGADGADGERGPGPTDQQVAEAVAAYCAGQPGGSCEGATGPQGDSGQPGTDGQDGQDGQDGEPGEPPFSWTFTTEPEGREYRCTRDENYTRDRPTYSCEQTSGPSS